jgi:hypothetical protein
MSYVSFYGFFPEIAKRETRSVTILPGSNTAVPAGEYGFVEMFCDEKGCDFRRVFLSVVSASKSDLHAVIAYAWESPAFYAKWMGDNDPEIIEALRGPCLNFGSPQSAAAPALLNLFKNVLLQDATYVNRIKRHYRMIREKVDGPEHRKWQVGKKRRNRRKA